MQQQTSTLTRKKIDYEGKSSIVDLWKRYDLAAPEGIAGQETGELQAVEKQVWKRRKIVPYNGINTIASWMNRLIGIYLYVVIKCFTKVIFY